MCVGVFTKVPIRGLVYDTTMVSEDVSETEDVNTGPRIQMTLKELFRFARHTQNKNSKN